VPLLYVPLLSYLSPRKEEEDLLPSFQDDVWILLGICNIEKNVEKKSKSRRIGSKVKPNHL
jgi:hypothetical protein